MGDAIVEKLGKLFHGGGLWLAIVQWRCEFANSSMQRGINGASVNRKGAEHFENTRFIGGVEGRGGIGEGSKLRFGAVVWSLPWVR